MRYLALLLMLCAGAGQAGPIYGDLQSPPPDQAADAPAALPLPVKSGPSLSAAIRLRDLSRFGDGYAAQSLAREVRPPEENLGVMRPDNYDPSHSQIDGSFFSAIGLDAAGLARQWGRGNAITGLEEPPGDKDVSYDFDSVDLSGYKALYDKYKGSLPEIEYKTKIYYKYTKSTPMMEPSGWFHDVLEFIHRMTSEFIDFILFNIKIVIVLNGLILAFMYFSGRRRS